MTLFNSKAKPTMATNDNYSCHKKAVSLDNVYNPSYRVHIMPYHDTSYYSLGGWTHMYTHIHMSTQRKPGVHTQLV